jgi:hypothetical protein
MSLPSKIRFNLAQVHKIIKASSIIHLAFLVGVKHFSLHIILWCRIITKRMNMWAIMIVRPVAITVCMSHLDIADAQDLNAIFENKVSKINWEQEFAAFDRRNARQHTWLHFGYSESWQELFFLAKCSGFWKNASVSNERSISCENPMIADLCVQLFFIEPISTINHLLNSHSCM